MINELNKENLKRIDTDDMDFLLDIHNALTHVKKHDSERGVLFLYAIDDVKDGKRLSSFNYSEGKLAPKIYLNFLIAQNKLSQEYFSATLTSVIESFKDFKKIDLNYTNKVLDLFKTELNKI